MLIVRDIFTCKPGQASKLAKLFKRAFANEPDARVLTDYVSTYNTVMIEMEVENLAAWEREMEAMMSGEKKMAPDVEADFANYTEMYQTGRREVWRVVE